MVLDPDQDWYSAKILNLDFGSETLVVNTYFLQIKFFFLAG
jgi:hypothetical protein